MQLIYSRGKSIGIVRPMSGVYGWLFPDGRWIVGSSKRIRKRLREYRRSTRTSIGTGFNQKAMDAIEKNGWNVTDLNAYVLESVLSETDLKRIESEWSIKLDSVVNGYNTVPAGELMYGSSGFRRGVSSAMVTYHERKRARGDDGYITKFDKLWENFYVSGGVLPKTNKECIHSTGPFAEEWNRSNVQRRIYIRNRVGGNRSHA